MEGAGAVGREVELWRVSPTPFIEIGVREGEDAFQLDRATGSARLDDGRIVVLDGGSRQLRFFDAEGGFLTAVGDEGEGPGEFRTPTRLRRAGGDSIQVWDARLDRVSFFSIRGEFLGSHLVEPSPEAPFPLDEWLFGRNWIDSPLSPEARGPIRRAVLAMPPPDSLGPPRFLKVTRQGRIWASGSFPPSARPVTWAVFDLGGRQVATVETPPRFEPHEVGHDYLIGRYRDELDINYIRAYRLEKPAGSPTGPGLDPNSVLDSAEREAVAGRAALAEGEAEAPVEGDAPAEGDTPADGEALAEGDASAEGEALTVPETFLEDVRRALMVAASGQEIHYSDNYTYTDDVEVLLESLPRRLEMPQGIDLAILLADDRGWIGTVTHRESQYMCALAYGAHMPMGWPPGTIICP